MSVDWELIDKLGRRSRLLSESEVADQECTPIAKRWLDSVFRPYQHRNYHPDAPRGEVTAKGSRDALFVGAATGEIDASH